MWFTKLAEMKYGAIPIRQLGAFVAGNRDALRREQTKLSGWLGRQHVNIKMRFHIISRVHHRGGRGVILSEPQAPIQSMWRWPCITTARPANASSVRTSAKPHISAVTARSADTSTIPAAIELALRNRARPGALQTEDGIAEIAHGEGALADLLLVEAIRSRTSS